MWATVLVLCHIYRKPVGNVSRFSMDHREPRPRIVKSSVDSDRPEIGKLGRDRGARIIIDIHLVNDDRVPSKQDHNSLTAETGRHEDFFGNIHFPRFFISESTRNSRAPYATIAHPKWCNRLLFGQPTVREQSVSRSASFWMSHPIDSSGFFHPMMNSSQTAQDTEKNWNKASLRDWRGK